jgi:hypothetical protein
MASIEKLMRMLRTHDVDPAVIAKIRRGYEDVTDRSTRRPAFLVHAMKVMDERLDFETRYRVRDACACSKSGWREQAMRRTARDYTGRSLEERLAAVGEVKYMGNPVLNADGTITGGVGTQGGFDCLCPALKGWQYEEPISPTYCLCCGGHFRHHYQIGLGVKLRTAAVQSSIPASQRRDPCRFVYEIVPAAAPRR